MGIIPSTCGGSSGSQGGFDYSQYMGGSQGSASASDSPGGFDYSQYMSGSQGSASASGSPGGFDYSQYMSGSQSNASGSEGFDYSQYVGSKPVQKTSDAHVAASVQKTSDAHVASSVPATSAVQLSASAPEPVKASSRPGLGGKFVLYILVGLSLPAALSFVKAVRSTVLRKPTPEMQE